MFLKIYYLCGEYTFIVDNSFLLLADDYTWATKITFYDTFDVNSYTAYFNLLHGILILL